MPTNNNQSLAKGTILEGSLYKYRIEKTLGQGSFGITYLASVKMVGPLGSIDTDMHVAIKEFFMRDINGRDVTVVTSGSQGGIYNDYKKKFTNEAHNLSKLNHPNIVKVTELFEANNTIYYVMEYIDGGNLDDYITEKNFLSEDEAINNIKQIGSALSFMHSNGMLHLDLKPANIMRKKSGDIVLIDFGLSKQYDSDGNPETSTKIGGGTPGYAPLEQSSYHEGRGFPVTMDVYALGATLFKMLTGHRPPEASDILNDGFPLYEFQEHNINDCISASIAKAMAPTAGARFKYVKYFLDSLNDNFTTIDIDITKDKKTLSPKTKNGFNDIYPISSIPNQDCKGKKYPIKKVLIISIIAQIILFPLSLITYPFLAYLTGSAVNIFPTIIWIISFVSFIILFITQKYTRKFWAALISPIILFSFLACLLTSLRYSGLICNGIFIGDFIEISEIFGDKNGIANKYGFTILTPNYFVFDMYEDNTAVVGYITASH